MMSKLVVLIWLGASSSRPLYQGDLDAWAFARLISLRAPLEQRGLARGFEQTESLQIEELLEQARALANSLDEALALARIQQAEQLLRANPELPQAGWLLAECFSIESHLLEKNPQAAERVALLRQQAFALEGARAAPFTSLVPAKRGDKRPLSATNLAPAHVETPKPVSVRITGLRSQDRLEWDGEPATERVYAIPGEHHARVLRRSQLVWAGFVEVQSSDLQIAIDSPTPVSCSLDDLSEPSIKNGRVVPPPSTRCASWAVARPAAGGGIEVATCEQAHCGQLLRWKRGFGSMYDDPPQRPLGSGWPAWASYTFAGLGVVAATGLLLWRTGVFEQRETNPDRVIFSGPH